MGEIQATSGGSPGASLYWKPQEVLLVRGAFDSYNNFWKLRETEPLGSPWAAACTETICGPACYTSGFPCHPTALKGEWERKNSGTCTTFLNTLLKRSVVAVVCEIG